MVTTIREQLEKLVTRGTMYLNGYKDGCMLACPGATHDGLYLCFKMVGGRDDVINYLIKLDDAGALEFVSEAGGGRGISDEDYLMTTLATEGIAIKTDDDRATVRAFLVDFLITFEDIDGVIQKLEKLSQFHLHSLNKDDLCFFQSLINLWSERVAERQSEI